MLVAIPALSDNYIWCYSRDNLHALLIDPATAEAVENFLAKSSLKLEAILVTHNHADHTGGVAQLRKKYPHVPVYAPTEVGSKLATHLVDSGIHHTPYYTIHVLMTGGHTAGHISYLVDNHLFCGDILFSLGCGRVFTGDYAQMFASLQKIKQLPDDTIVCAAHEYTLSNLRFAQSVANSVALTEYAKKIEQLRAEQRPTLPTTLGLEKALNPFLRCENLESFIALRQAKDKF
ncbi:hydroxyacylglutathione hydrolase [Gallibacterium salpingitidis]|uniref:Hydroxyacylglutathione hydrolase n=1 Tax=Gallibacterium salpingitidis TaxID=505341 RepID=A0AB36E4N3_9PAST|nr:hydroxyacylglutathione hydrolase [Gallibacterium salpingitidis]OBX07910.1 hydroxyacylglutathione hydrolase [Gallibacterium salpingitidis]OBX11497.1 hydroxyacylglutathione hydrolase [Gallibacterium salpingitidis]WKT00710.1 hydroxyacylglutathione hydrolase [Gallibacterium salpingitidis]